MNATKMTLLVTGTLLAFALAAAPGSKTQVQPEASAATPFSADHARIEAPAEELPSQF